MTDRPIIFSAPMIRALLDGRKTQTRRVLKPQPFPCADGWGCVDRNGAPQKWLPCLPKLHPYTPGDRLWVKEAHAFDIEANTVDEREIIWYRATQHVDEVHWRSPIHMPRWASRLTLHVTDVRVQRLQEIGFDDCRAEGADPLWREYIHPQQCPEPRCDGVHYGEKWHFRSIWNGIHGPDAWDANPWVAAISFTARRCNIDTMEEGTW